MLERLYGGSRKGYADGGHRSTTGGASGCLSGTPIAAAISSTGRPFRVIGGDGEVQAAYIISACSRNVGYLWAHSPVRAKA